MTTAEKNLFGAVRKGDVAKAQELLEKGCNPNCVYTPKNSAQLNLTPLHEAAYTQNLAMLEVLLKFGANVHAETPSYDEPNEPGETALDMACSGCSDEIDLEVVKLLLRHGADPNHRSGSRRPSTFENSIRGKRIDIQLALLDAGADVNPQVKNVLSPLIRAADVGNLELAQLLLKRGADVNYFQSRYEARTTALIRAADLGHLDIVKLLLAQGADAKVREPKYDRDALAYACIRSSFYHLADWNARWCEMLELLLKAGCDVNYVDKLGFRPMDLLCHAAPEPVKKAAVAFLESHGAKPAGTA